MRILKTSTLFLACSAAALAAHAAIADPVPAPKGPGAPPSFERMCANPAAGDKMAGFQAMVVKRLTEDLKLTDVQVTAFKDLQATRAKVMSEAKAAICAAKPDLSSFEKRLAFREVMAQRRLDNLKAETPKMIAFYNTLDTVQKTRFEDYVAHRNHRGGHNAPPLPPEGEGE